jgi:hypothetical protein
MLDAYFNAEQMDKVQASVDSLCAEVRKCAGMSQLYKPVGHQLTSSTPRRLFCSIGPHHQLATR